jgi:hypothetical protein
VPFLFLSSVQSSISSAAIFLGVSVIAVLVTLLIRSVIFAVLAPVDGQKGAKKAASAAPKWTDAKKRKHVAADCWLTMLKLPLPLDVYKKVMHILLAAISYCAFAWTHWLSFAWISKPPLLQARKGSGGCASVSPGQVQPRLLFPAVFWGCTNMNVASSTQFLELLGFSSIFCNCWIALHTFRFQLLNSELQDNGALCQDCTVRSVTRLQCALPNNFVLFHDRSW